VAPILWWAEDELYTGSGKKESWHVASTKGPKRTVLGVELRWINIGVAPNIMNLVEEKQNKSRDIRKKYIVGLGLTDGSTTI
jgi:hypothetical protein